MTLGEAAAHLGMTVRGLRERLARGGHGFTVHERQGHGRVRRFLRADEVKTAAGGFDGGLLREAAEEARSLR